MKIEIYENPSQEIKNSAYAFGLTNFYDSTTDIKAESKEVEEKYFSVPHAILLAYENDDIVGRIYLHKREIKLGKNTILLGGIGGVCTHKDKRHQGMATLMLEKSMDVLRKWKCDVAYLCTNIDKLGKLYTNVGFVPLNKKYTFRGKSGKLYEENSGMIAEVNSAELFDEIMDPKTKVYLGEGNW